MLRALLRRSALALVCALLVPGCGPSEAEVTDGELTDSEVEEWLGESSDALAELEYDEVGNLAPTPGEPVTVRFERSWAIGSFQPEGDKFFLFDRAADGMSIGLHWKTVRGGTVTRRGLCRHKLGTSQGEFPLGCNKNLPEGQLLFVRLGRCDGDKGDCRTLGPWQNWTRWRVSGT